MKAFRYDRPATIEAAVRALEGGGAVLKANGIDLLDRMKERVDEPDRVVTLVDVPGLDGVERTREGGLRVGAMATFARIAESPDARALAPALAQAAASAASPQLRSRATLGGSLGQHTRCGYYRLKSFPCFKRGDPSCPVLAPGGVQDNAGLFGIEFCACAHPSSLAPALGAAGATVVVRGPQGERAMTMGALYEAPSRGKASDTTLGPAEVIERVEVPGLGEGEREAFYEVRQRAQFDWALVAAAVWWRVEKGRVADARVWLGAVAPTPIASSAAREALVGREAGDGPLPEAAVEAAGEAAAVGATPLPGNAYKVDLVKVAVKRALRLAGAGRKG